MQRDGRLTEEAFACKGHDPRSSRMYNPETFLLLLSRRSHIADEKQKILS